MAKDKRTEQRPQYDSPWKQAIEGYFPDFMSFFFSDIHKEIDWNKEPVFMDNVLEKITRDAEIGMRYADKLVKVWLKTGELVWALIHIEVQASRETNFSERIYVYRHRIWEKHKVDVASLVILCDDEQNYRPNKYKKGIWGCELIPICNQDDAMLYSCHGGVAWQELFISVSLRTGRILKV